MPTPAQLITSRAEILAEVKKTGGSLASHPLSHLLWGLRQAGGLGGVQEEETCRAKASDRMTQADKAKCHGYEGVRSPALTEATDCELV